jgi:hypothetical protein
MIFKYGWLVNTSDLFERLSDAYFLRIGFFMHWGMPNRLDSAMIRKGLRVLDMIVNLDKAFARLSLIYQPVSAPEMVCCMRNNLLWGTEWPAMVQAALGQVPVELINRPKTDLRFRRENGSKQKQRSTTYWAGHGRFTRGLLGICSFPLNSDEKTTCPFQ